MKFKVAYVLAALIFASCGKLGDKAKDAVDAVSEIGFDKDAKIIAYNNAMVAYMRNTGGKIDRVADDYAKINNMVVNKKKPTVFIANAFIGSMPDINREEGGVLLLEPGNHLPSEIKDELTASVKATSEAFKKTHQAYTEFKEYYQNEDYKDDDWAKGQTYLDVIKQNITLFYDKREESYKILKPVADAAEIEMLKDHPLRETLIATKTDLAIVEAIVGIVFDEQVNMELLNMKYDQLEANYTKHKDLTPELLKEHNKDYLYENYYNQIKDFLGEVRKCKRDGKIDIDEADDIGSEYQSLIDYYNSFV